MTNPAQPLMLGAIFYDHFALLDVYGPLDMFGCVGPQLRIATVAVSATGANCLQQGRTG